MTDNPSPHAISHQEGIGVDSFVNIGMFERIARVQKTTVNATPAMFTGIASNTDNTLQSGHGWTSSNFGTNGSLNYTNDSILGTQCIQITTKGDGTSTSVTSPRMTAFNMSGKMMRLWLKLDAATANHVSKVLVYVGSGASQFLNFANCQVTAGYTAVTALTEWWKPGEWVPITLVPASFFNGVTGTVDWTSLQDFRILINDDNTGNPVNVLFGGLDFIPNDSAYASGVVSLTFDDGLAGQFTIARPKMEQYGYKGTFYAMQDAIGNTGGGYMSQAQLNQLQTLGHEIAIESYYTANHNAGFVGMAPQTARTDWGLIKGWMHQKGYRGLEHMDYSLGQFDASLLALVKQQFAAARTTVNRSVETLPVADPYRLRALTVAANGAAVTPNGTVGTVEWMLDQIATNGGWLIIFSHDFVASGATGSQTNQATWNTLVDYIATKGIPVRTVGDVLGL